MARHPLVCFATTTPLPFVKYTHLVLMIPAGYLSCHLHSLPFVKYIHLLLLIPSGYLSCHLHSLPLVKYTHLVLMIPAGYLSLPSPLVLDCFHKRV